jgi:hypothetical protein
VSHPWAGLPFALASVSFSPAIFFLPPAIVVFSSIFYPNLRGGKKCGVSMMFNEEPTTTRKAPRYTVIVFH